MTNRKLILLRAVRSAFEIRARATGCAQKSWAARLFLLVVLAFTPSAAHAAATAPVIVPAGGFGIDGDLLANTPTNNVGDWLTNSASAGAGGFVLFTNGTPVNSNITFHVVDLFNSGVDDGFKGGSKVDDNPDTATSSKWEWDLSTQTPKDDINNALFHLTQDATGHIWVVISADRRSDNGSSYIDFEFLQNTLSLTTNVGGTSGGFASAGPNCGRTTNDFLLTIELANGGSSASFHVQRWLAAGGGCGFDYVDVTFPTNAVFVAVNPTTVAVPYGAFGATTYAANLFAEAAIDVTVLFGSFDPCLTIGIKTILIKTKTSASPSATIKDFVAPHQVTLTLGLADAGLDQTNCSAGASTSFNLTGTAHPSVNPITNMTWSVVSGPASIVSGTSCTNCTTLPAVVNVTGTQTNATLRLTVRDSSGCTTSDDVILAVIPATTASVPTNQTTCPGGTVSFTTVASGTGPFTYRWTQDGALLAGRTNSSLNVTNVTATNAGVYCVEVTGFCTSVTNCATLTVLTNTSATTPNSVTNCLGTPASFSTVASGTGPFSYQWTKDGSPLAGATNSSFSITNVSSSDAGQYCVAVSGSCASITNCATLIVRTNTSATPLTSLTNCPGATVNFSTVASGDGPFSYQWTKNGTNLSGATNSSLSIAAVSASDAGAYCVRIIGFCTSITNCASLVVATNTSATPLTSLTNCLGTSANFSTVANGTGPFSYQWTKDGNPIADATNSSYSIASISGSDAGTYCVQVTGACGSATNCASLTLRTDGSATPLTSLTNCPATPASFSTIASGTGPFSYQWTKDGSPISGATNSSYSIASVTAGDAGIYCVQVTGACGNVTNCATLTVLTNPTATSLTAVTNCPGGSASFSTAPGGTGPFGYQWTKDGGALAGATNSSLTINNLNATNAGQYCVIVTGFCASVTNCATLTVLTNTTATSLSSVTNCPGGSASFSTAPGGTGPFGYQWTKDGGALAGATNSSLTVNNLNATNAGQYCVIVTGFCASVTNCATLTVLTNTSATPLSSITVCLGSPASFSTVASGTGPLTFQWTKNGTNLTGATNSSLTVNNLNATNAGQYCVIVSGFCTSVTNCATLTVLTNTTATSLTSLTNCPGAAANFSTTPSGTGPFSYQWTKGGAPISDATNNSYAIAGVQAGDAGQYCVIVSGFCTSVTNCAALTVLTNTTATSLTSVTNCPGGSASFSTAPGGTGPFGYQWTKDGGALAGATNSSLTINNLNATNAGQYCVIVSGFCTSVTNYATLTVLTNTSASALTSLTNCPGSAALFSTVAGGTGSFSYQWTKGGSPIPDATNSAYSIASVTAGDAGTYCVRVSGFCTSLTNCATLTVLTPKITLTKACPPAPVTPGGVLVFSGTVSNSGSVTLTNVIVVDNRPTNNTPVIGPLTLAPGQAMNFSGSYTVDTDTCGPCVDTLTATANPACGTSAVTDSASASCPVTTTAALGLNRACPPDPVPLGQPVIYTGSVSNAGNATLTNVIVYGSLPTNNTPVFGPVTLAPGKRLDFDGSFIVPLDSCAAGVSFTLTASGKSLCTGSNIVQSVTQTCPVTMTPRLTLIKNCPVNPVPPGGVLTFSGVVSNAGNVTLTNVVVVNNHPTNHTPVIGPLTLAPGQTTNFSGSYRVCPECCPPYVDTLTATGAQICNGSNVTATVTKSCAGSTAPQLGLQVDCPAAPAMVGQLLFYSGSVSNAGDVPLSGVLISDNHSGFVAQFAALAPLESADFFGFYLATNCGPGVVTLVTATASDACTGGSVNKSSSIACSIDCSVIRPVLLNLRISGGQFQFSLATELGHTYTVQHSDAVQPTNWQTLTTFPGTGGLVTVTDTTANPKQFYRVLVE